MDLSEPGLHSLTLSRITTRYLGFPPGAALSLHRRWANRSVAQMSSLGIIIALSHRYRSSLSRRLQLSLLYVAYLRRTLPLPHSIKDTRRNAKSTFVFAGFAPGPVQADAFGLKLTRQYLYLIPLVRGQVCRYFHEFGIDAGTLRFDGSVLQS